MTVVQVLNTKGAARRLGCSETWIHKLVATSKLKAYIYDTDGVLVEREPEGKRQGQGLYFLVEDNWPARVWMNTEKSAGHAQRRRAGAHPTRLLS